MSAQEHPSLTDQISNKCRHFNGIQHNVCDAGIAYASVQNYRERPLRLPCLKEDGCSERCPKASFLSPDEVAEQEAKIRAAVVNALTEMALGICPHCHQKVEKQVQHGMCLYNQPCGCRLGVGTVEDEA